MFSRSLAVGAFTVLVASVGFAAAQSHDKHNPYNKHNSGSTQTQPTSNKPDDKKADTVLKVGDAAPALKVDKWVKGEEVSSFQQGKVYVVEFWATWCKPCKDSIPHLTDLQHKYKDAVFIGVAASEHEPKGNAPDTRLDDLKKFVATMGSKMDYRVAYDPARAMGTSWLTAADQKTIPTAFIVDATGKIAYIGNPSGLADPLAKAMKSAAPSTTDSTKPVDSSKTGPSTAPTPTPKPDKKK